MMIAHAFSFRIGGHISNFVSQRPFNGTFNVNI